MFYVKAIFPILLAINLMFAGIVYVIFKNDRSAKLWIIGCLLAATGFSLILLRGAWPNLLTYLLANFLILVAWFFFAAAIEILLKGSLKILKWAVPIGLLYVIGLELIQNSNNKGLVPIHVGITWSLVNLSFFFLIRWFNTDHQNKYVKFLAYLHLCSAFVWIARAILSQVYEFTFILDDSFANWATNLINLLLIVLRQFAYLAIRFDFVKEEKNQVERLLVERESLIANLLKANKTAATGALSASIAHELNQPLCATDLNIQLLKTRLGKGLLNLESEKKVLDALDEDNKRAALIVSSLRSIFSDEDVITEYVDFGLVIEGVLEIVKPELKSRNIQIVLRVDQDLKVQVNQTEIQQIFLNLINNSIQAISITQAHQGCIQIEAHEKYGMAQICISDNGGGVSKERKSELFELLNTTKQTGMGIGLWLCKHIVTRNGGSIYYEDALGGGARFVVQLPLSVKK